MAFPTYMPSYGGYQGGYQNGFYMTQPYQQVQQPTQVAQLSQIAQAQNGAQGGLNWVEGAEAAKAYAVPPNCTLVLFDTKNPIMYIKSADMSGMPSTRTFRIEEIGDVPIGAAGKSEVPPSVSREEIEEFENRISALEKQIQGMAAKPKGKTKEAAENESTV